MILTCPTCATRYDADVSGFPPSGRAVRCASCGHSWLAGPDGLSVDGPVLPSPAGLSRAEVERARRQAMEPATNYRAKVQADARRAALIRSGVTWACAAGFLAGALGLAVLFRDDVVRIWPKAGSAFAMVGLPANATGLEFVNVKAARTFEGAMPVLAVTGLVKNVSDRESAPPPVTVTLRDQTGEKLFEWTVRPAALTLAPGGEAPFQTRVGHPPLEAFDVSVTFADMPGPPAKPHAAVAPAAMTAPKTAPSAPSKAAPSHLEPDPAAPSAHPPSAAAPNAAEEGHDAHS